MNLHFDSYAQWLEYTIDGHKTRVDAELLGEILELPHEYDEGIPLVIASFKFDHSISAFLGIMSDFSTDGTRGSEEIIPLLAMPERVCLLDRIYRENLFPLGHHSEQRAKIFWALYSAHKGHFYSLFGLTLAELIKMRSEIISRISTGRAKSIPYGFLITAIL